MSEYGQLDRAALDRWITREPYEERCEECGAIAGECAHTYDAEGEAALEAAAAEAWGE